MASPVLAITAGEPAGIGPDLVLDLATIHSLSRLVVIADRGLLEQRAQQLNRALSFIDYAPNQTPPPGSLEVLHTSLQEKCSPGQLNSANASYVLNTLDIAIDGCLSGQFSAMITAPVHKGIINDAGIAFTGHTEYLAEKTHTPKVVMMLTGGGMRVALATTHLPLRSVPDAITMHLLEEVIHILHHDLVNKFGIPKPNILIAGLNPHAGEDGHMGREEIDVIQPVITRLRSRGYNLSNPLPADTLFNPDKLAHADAVLAMYHDQGLPVLKHASFGAGINITLGLPIIRTSVDHGTALNIAGQGLANPGSLFEAVKLAENLAINQQQIPR